MTRKKINIGSRLSAGLFFLLLACACGSKKETAVAQTGASLKAWQVEGVVTRNYPYCGGARPSEEIMAEANSPKPFAGKMLHLIRGDFHAKDREVMASFETDSAGKFSFDLIAGSYVVLTDEQFNKTPLKEFTSELIKGDEVCYNEWLDKPVLSFTVSDRDIKDLKIHFQYRCFVNTYIPCMHYDGPLPP